MTTNPTPSDADLILDELDRLAREPRPAADFWKQVLGSLLRITTAEGGALLVPVEGTWVPIETLGSFAARDGAKGWDVPPFDETRSTSFHSGIRDEKTWVAFCESREGVGAICPVLVFPSSGPIGFVPSLEPLLEAYCDVMLTRVAADKTNGLQSTWTTIQAAIEEMTHAGTPWQLNQVLVDRLRQTLGCARVSLVEWDSLRTKAELTNSSGVSKIDAHSEVVHSMVRLVASAAERGEPTVYSDTSIPRKDEGAISNSLFPHRILLPWGRLPFGCMAWLVLEWSHASELHATLPDLGRRCASLQSTYSQQQKWLAVPKRQRDRATRSSAGWRLLRWKRYATIAIIAALMGGLFLPYPFTIEAEGVLEPAQQRFVHATADGTVHELFVEDGARVAQGDRLAILRSAGIELQIEETLGEMRTVGEKRNGVHVAMNQSDGNNTESQTSQTRLATELLVLETQEKHLREKLAFLKSEQKELELKAPIEGTIVGTKVRQELENRPVKRGDPLLRIAHLDGPWRLKIQLADRDTGYVDAHYGDGEGYIHFSMESNPEHQSRAKLVPTLKVTENPQGTGSYRTMYASLEPEDAKAAKLGATVRVHFPCGTQPVWFAWSRPLVEFLQKRIPFGIHRATGSVDEKDGRS